MKLSDPETLSKDYNRRRLLIMDGFASHVKFQFLIACDDRRISVLTLPAYFNRLRLVPSLRCPQHIPPSWSSAGAQERGGRSSIRLCASASSLMLGIELSPSSCWELVKPRREFKRCDVSGDGFSRSFHSLPFDIGLGFEGTVRLAL